MWPVIIAAAAGLGALMYYKKKEDHPQKPDAPPAQPGTAQMKIDPQPLPPVVQSTDNVTLAQRILAKFYASADGHSADKTYQAASPITFTASDITGQMSPRTREAIVKFQEWADDFLYPDGQPRIHIPAPDGTWRQYGDLDAATMQALSDWTLRSQ